MPQDTMGVGHRAPPRGSPWREDHFLRGGQGRKALFWLGWGPPGQLGRGGWAPPAQGCRLPRPARPSVPCPALESPSMQIAHEAHHKKEHPQTERPRTPEGDGGEEGKEKCDIPQLGREREMERERQGL